MGNSLSRKNVDKSLFIETNVESEEKECLPIYFNHKVHGENVIISEDKRIAKRIRSYCKGICYSSRPINVNEIICIKIYETSDKWSGVLRFGFVASNPNDFYFKHKNSQDSHLKNTHSQQILPKYSCPDLNNLIGNWAKALPISYVMENTFLSFYYDEFGCVHYILNGKDRDILFTMENFKNGSPKQPLWAMFDLYGNTIALELIYPSLGEINVNNFVSNPKSINGPTIFNKGNLNGFSNNIHNFNGDDTSSMPSNTVPSSISKYYHSFADSDGSNLFNIISFHTHPNAKGKNVEIIYLQTISPKSSNSEINFQRGTSTRPTNSFNPKDIPAQHIANEKNFVVAARKSGEFCNAYAFTCRPLKSNEKVLVKILATENHYVGSLAFGLTTCDPASLKPANCLPDEANFLIDRPEYWVVAKDLSPAGLEIGDELAFYIDPQGQVIMEKNGFFIGTIMYVDTTQQLWAFWDLYGSAQKIRLLGSYHITLGINELENQMQLRRLINISANNANTSRGIQNGGLEPAPFQAGPALNNPYDRLPIAPRNESRAVINSLIPRDIYELSPRFNGVSNGSTNSFTTPPQNSCPPHYQTPSSTYNNNSVGLEGARMSLDRAVNLNVAPRRPLKSSKPGPPNARTATPNAPQTPNSFLANVNSTTVTTGNGGPHTAITSPHSHRFQQYDNGEARLTKKVEPGPNSGQVDQKFSAGPANITAPAPPPLTSHLLNQQECVVCYERSLDCLLYPCGHICMCHPCATATWKMKAPQKFDTTLEDSDGSDLSPAGRPNVLGLCPICRSTIQEVVKIFLP